MRSTVGILAELTTDILNAFSQKKKNLMAVFFAIEKAYDTTWRYKILQSIHQCGLSGLHAFFY